MTAQEANDIAKAKNISIFYECLDKIMENIKHHSKHGYFELTCWDKLNDDVKKHLLELDYGLENPEEGCTIISWRL